MSESIKLFKSGKRYRCTAFQGNYVTFIEIVEKIKNSSDVVSVLYCNKLYLVTTSQLFESGDDSCL